jgi:hypothetical protein
MAWPTSDGYTQILLVVDCFSKMAHFIALKETVTVLDTAQEFMKKVWKLHESPKLRVSDLETKWTSEFWDELRTLLVIMEGMLSSFFPQTDWKTQRVHQTLKMYF